MHVKIFAGLLAISGCFCSLSASAAVPDGEIAMQCDSSAWSQPTLINGIFETIDVEQHHRIDSEGRSFLAFSDIDDNKTMFKMLRLCAVTLKDQPAYVLKIKGFLPPGADSTIRRLIRGYSPEYGLWDGAPEDIRIYLDQVSTVPHTARLLSRVLYEADKPVETIIPFDGSCETISCALILTGAPTRHVQGVFAVSKVGPPEFDWDKIDDLAQVVVNLKMQFKKYGVDPAIVMAFLEAQERRRISQAQLQAWGVIKHPE